MLGWFAFGKITSSFFRRVAKVPLVWFFFSMDFIASVFYGSLLAQHLCTAPNYPLPSSGPMSYLSVSFFTLSLTSWLILWRKVSLIDERWFSQCSAFKSECFRSTGVSLLASRNLRTSELNPSITSSSSEVRNFSS